METKNLLAFGPFSADLGQRVLLRDGQPVPLPGKAFEVLIVLLQRPRQVVSKEDLMKAVWPDTFVEEGNLTQTIFVLRKALGDTEGQGFIVTIPRQGYRFAGEVTSLGNQESGKDVSGREPAAPARVARGTRSLWLLAGGLILAAGGAWWSAGRTPKPPMSAPFMSLTMDLGPEAVANGNTTVAISPDGSHIAYRIRAADSNPILAVRALNVPENQPAVTSLAGTVGAVYPFFSPDGQWIAYLADGTLKKIPAQGGAPVTICDAPEFAGGSWGEDNRIVAAIRSPSGLLRINAAGGEPQLLAKPANHKANFFRPRSLPGGEAVIYTAREAATSFEDASIEAISWKTGEWKSLYKGGYFGRYLPSGHLVWVRNRTLFGARFDPVSLAMKSPPVALVENDLSSNPDVGDGRFDFSRNGTLVYISGNQERSVVWMDPAGHTQPLITHPAHYRDPTLSPDGRFLAMTIGLGKRELHIFDIQRQTSSRRTFSRECRYPAWTLDGRYVAIGCSDLGGSTIWWMRADGSGEPQSIYQTPGEVGRFLLSPDGKTLMVSPRTQDVLRIPLDITNPDYPKAEKPERFMPGGLLGWTGAFSPDGKWFAYSSHDPADAGIFVRPARPGQPGRWQISAGEGRHPTWSRSGPQLLYQDNNGFIQVVDYAIDGDSFSSGKARHWVDRQFALGVSTTPGRNFDLAPDGKRIVAFETSANLHITFLVNFFDELKRRLPDGP